MSERVTNEEIVVSGEDVRLVRGGWMVQMWRMTGGSIRTRRSWGGKWKRLSLRDVLMLRDDVRQGLLRSRFNPRRSGE